MLCFVVCSQAGFCHEEPVSMQNIIQMTHDGECDMLKYTLYMSFSWNVNTTSKPEFWPFNWGTYTFACHMSPSRVICFVASLTKIRLNRRHPLSFRILDGASQLSLPSLARSSSWCRDWAWHYSAVMLPAFWGLMRFFLFIDISVTYITSFCTSLDRDTFCKYSWKCE